MKDEDVGILARQILDDLRGSAYYADPEILASVLGPHLQNASDGYGVAVHVLRSILMQYIRMVPDDDIISTIDSALKAR